MIPIDFEVELFLLFSHQVIFTVPKFLALVSLFIVCNYFSYFPIEYVCLIMFLPIMPTFYIFPLAFDNPIYILMPTVN